MLLNILVCNSERRVAAGRLSRMVARRIRPSKPLDFVRPVGNILLLYQEGPSAVLQKAVGS